jgi:NADP-dependent 3-hydroxy acid dehydrogenase YdfG
MAVVNGTLLTETVAPVTGFSSGIGPATARPLAADAYIVTRDRRVAVNEVLLRAGEQTW